MACGDRAGGNFARIRHILLPHEYLNFWLTGEMRAEYGDASGTAYFDVRSRQWVREVLDSIDGGSGQLFAALPPLIGSDELVGRLRPEVAAELGLPAACMAAAGGGDNMMGAIGTGNVREGVVTLSLGTSSTVYSFSERPAYDPTGNVAPFCSSSGGWLPLVCTMNAANVVTGTVELLGKTVDDLDPALEETPPGAEGLVFLPFLNGERTPDLPAARGSLHGFSANNFTSNHLLRAAVEGVSFGILNGLDLVLEGKPAATISAIGGGWPLARVAAAACGCDGSGHPRAGRRGIRLSGCGHTGHSRVVGGERLDPQLCGDSRCGSEGRRSRNLLSAAGVARSVPRSPRPVQPATRSVLSTTQPDARYASRHTVVGPHESVARR